MADTVLITQNVTGNDLGTFKQRVISEVRRASESDSNAITIEMISAMRHFRPLRAWWKESTHLFYLTPDQQAYGFETGTTEGLPADFVSAVNVYILVGGTRWLPLRQSDHNDVRWLTPTETVVGVPTEYSYFDDQLWFTPIPNATFTQPVNDVEYNVRLDYIQDTGALNYIWTGTDWQFRNQNSNDIVDDTWTSPWLTYGEELLRARTKWGLYHNYYDDAENAFKMGGVDGDGGLVEAALANMMKRHNSTKYNVERASSLGGRETYL